MTEAEILAFIVQRVKRGITEYDAETKGNMFKLAHFATGFQAIYHKLKEEGRLE